MSRALEFYSGIGGFHYSILLSGQPIEVVQAFDIHAFANQTYAYNFKSQPNQKNIEALTPKDIDQYAAAFWVMSPPCQPYTRQKEALQKGSNDPRAKSFLHLLSIFPDLRHQPSYIVIENVVGFESSDTRTLVVDLLEKHNYAWQEFHLSPASFGIPNQRMRYYLLAKKKPHRFMHEAQGILKEIPLCVPKEATLPLSSYLDPLDGDTIIPYLVPEKTILSTGLLFDIQLFIYPSSVRSCCFTRSYSHKVEGAGSVLQLAPKDTPCTSDPASLIPLKLRYFTPMEIARLHGFPHHFAYPPTVNTRQCYRLIGNSLTVVVVSELIKYIMTSPT